MGEQHWCQREFAEIDFGDKRLNERFIKTAQRISEQPTASINQACTDWAEAKGAYRLFDNEKIEVQKMLDAHRKKTQERIEGNQCILVIQDTSFLNYTGHFKTLGLGPIGKYNETQSNVKGLVVHTALALTLEGLPLGILDQEIWARKSEDLRPIWRKKAKVKRVPIQ